MTPRERHLLDMLATITERGELIGFRWGLEQQDEYHGIVQEQIQEKAIANGWWPLHR